MSDDIELVLWMSFTIIVSTIANLIYTKVENKLKIVRKQYLERQEHKLNLKIAEYKKNKEPL